MRLHLRGSTYNFLSSVDKLQFYDSSFHTSNTFLPSTNNFLLHDCFPHNVDTLSAPPFSSHLSPVHEYCVACWVPLLVPPRVISLLSDLKLLFKSSLSVSSPSEILGAHVAGLGYSQPTEPTPLLPRTTPFVRLPVHFGVPR